MRKLLLVGLVLSVVSVYAMETESDEKLLLESFLAIPTEETEKIEEETLESPKAMTMNKEDCDCSKLQTAKDIGYEICCCGCSDDMVQEFGSAPIKNLHNGPFIFCMVCFLGQTIAVTGRLLGDAMEYAIPHAANYAAHYYTPLRIVSLGVAGYIFSKKLGRKKTSHKKEE